MKFIAHIPTEQYGFIEIEAEITKDNDFNVLMKDYFEIKDSYAKKLKDREDAKPPFDIQNPPRNPHLDLSPNDKLILEKTKEQLLVKKLLVKK